MIILTGSGGSKYYHICSLAGDRNLGIRKSTARIARCRYVYAEKFSKSIVPMILALS